MSKTTNGPPAATFQVETTEQLTFGNGGWLRYQSADLPVPVFVRVEDAGTRFRISELYFGGPSLAITGQLVRRIPFNRIEAWANEEGGAVSRRLHRAAPDLRRLISHFQSGVPKTWNQPADDPLNWVERSLLAQFDNNDEPQAPGIALAAPLDRASLRIDAKLPPRTGRRYGDEFYRAVANVYGQLIRYVRDPGGVIADVNEVPVSTAHRWIKVARQRGFLPPAVQGKAG